MATTVVAEDGTTIVSEPNEEDRSFRHRLAWGPIFAGAVVGTATIFFLLTLGAGVGLSLVPASGVASKGFLTLGAIYFLAAQAFGFAVGGHLVGRLIGPMAETDREEEFRAAAHGLTVWGLCVTATALLVLLSSWVAAGSTAMAGGMVMAPGNSNTAPSPAISAYWTDVLFRPAIAPMHASLAWKRYAQADTTATDAQPTNDDESPTTTTVKPMTPMTGNSSGNSGKIENDVPAPSPGTTEAAPSRSVAPHVITIPQNGDEAGNAVPTTTNAPASRNIAAADKAEAGRILEVGTANGGTLSQYDRDRLAELVAQDTGVSNVEAARRVDNAQVRIRADQMRTAEAARKAARNASLWIALALLFSAVVATMAAISARWEDDRVTFGFRRDEPA
jgi:hypothetical protein